LIKGPKRGWEKPGGQVEEGESLIEAAIRETKEEAGIDVEFIRFCGVFQNVKKSICNTLFLARPVGIKLSTSSESLDVGYFPIDKTLKMVTHGIFRDRIELCLDISKQPFLIEF